MAQFAPVAPIQVLEQLYLKRPVEGFGPMHLLLAHHTVEHPDRFTALFTRAKEFFDGRDQDLVVIMDNSVVETGGAVNIEMMHVACGAINDAGITPIAVLPDVMGDGKATRTATEEALADDEWQALGATSEFMMVLQGPDEESVLENLDLCLDTDAITWIGIPRVLVKSLGSRQAVTKKILGRIAESGKQFKGVHLLGFSDNMQDDIATAHFLGIDSIDSAVPLRYPGHFDFSDDGGPRAVDWFDKAWANSQMANNILLTREALA